MSDQPKKLQESGQWTRQAVKFVTAATMGSTLMVLSGLILTATVIALIVVTPALVLFSPVLVPAAIAVFMAAAGLLFSGGCGTAAVAVASWVYNYVRGKHPPGADQLDQARRRITEKAREVGQVVQSKAHEVGQGS